MNIVLGSTSDHKLDAVRHACSALGLNATVTGVKAPSGQNEQPVGFEETYAGALTRAKAAQSQHKDHVAIGIESGIFCFGTGTPVTLDMAVIVLLTNDARQIVTTSSGIQFPEEYVVIARERGFEETTVGSVIAEKLGGDGTDPHTTLTNGAVTRTMTLVEALKVALRQV